MRRALVILGLAACGSTPASHTAPVPVTPPSCPPEGWNPQDMARASLYEPLPALRQIRVLAWKQAVDDRPLYIDSALMWIEHADRQFTIANLFRHPKDGGTWEQAMIFDLPGFQGAVTLEHRPTHADLESFLSHTDFTFGPESDFRMLASGVCASAWLAAFTEAPWHRFGPDS